MFALAFSMNPSASTVAWQRVKQLDDAAASLVAHELFQSGGLGLGTESTDLELVNGW